MFGDDDANRGSEDSAPGCWSRLFRPFEEENIFDWDATERARHGIFMAFQRPMAIPGVKMADFLRHATTNVRNPERKEGEQLIPMREFRKELKEKIAADFKAVVADGSIGDRLKATGQVINVGGPKEFADSIDEQRAKVAATVKAIDFKPRQ